MAVGGCYFDARQDKEVVDGQAVEAHQSFFEQISDGLGCVVIGDGETVQPFRAGGGD